MRSSHIVGAFDAELQGLSRRIAAMGGLAERMVEEAAHALASGEAPLARKVVESDEALDLAQRELDDAAVTMLARRQPVSSDLHEIIAAIRIASELERVGDLAKNIAKRVGALGSGDLPPGFAHGLRALAEAALFQLKDVLDAYAARATDALHAMRERDREIDRVFTSLFGDLLAWMSTDPHSVEDATHLLFCIKNLERIGDHATNIAETVFHMMTGEAMPPERPKDDRSHGMLAAEGEPLRRIG
ncbi:MAG: phosphate transport system regulatory protein PhoU [Mesorhizobium amorphae]|nr:MAG: phosphate transport system regulatory protein PhoU [Mesorhizobium amorphae]